MPLLIITGLFLSLFAILGFLTWLAFFLFKVRHHGRKVFKVTLLLLVILFPVVLFLILPVAFSHLVAHASTRPQDRLLSETPATFGCQYTPIEFPSRDGLLLKGWLIKGSPSNPPIIFSHGLFRNRQEILERACDLNRQGFPVLVFDFRSHGESQRKIISLGYHERLDVLGAIDFALGHLGSENVVVAGVSMGAVASIFAARDSRDSIAAIIADSPFDTLEDTVGRHTQLFLNLPARPFSDMFIWNLARLAEFQARRFNTLSSFASLRGVPVLLLYGKSDQRMTREVAGSLYSAIPHSDKKLVFFEGADHGGAFDSAPEEYVKCIVDFLSAGLHN